MEVSNEWIKSDGISFKLIKELTGWISKDISGEKEILIRCVFRGT